MNLLQALSATCISIIAIKAQALHNAPRFEVASLKSNAGCQNMPQPPRNLSPSPGRLELTCATLQDFIRYAYGMFRDGATANLAPLRVDGGPHWMQSDYFSLSAKSDGFEPTELLAGPILQRLLEERFHLNVHYEGREMPIYIMTVTKGGLKVDRMANDACTPIDLSHPAPTPPAGQLAPNLCGVSVPGTTAKGALTMELRAGTITELAQRLSPRVKRMVVDKTGVAGRFTFHLEYAPEAPASSPDATNPAVPPLAQDIGPNIFEALQEQIGVKLTPGKGPVEYLVVDSAEKPTRN